MLCYRQNGQKEDNMTYIPLSKYAENNNRSSSYIRRKAERGGFNTAVKIGRNWIIDEHEPYLDDRKKKSSY